MIRINYIRPCFCNKLHNVIGYVSLDINLLLLSWTLKQIIQKIIIRYGMHKEDQVSYYLEIIHTLTTDAPVANFFPSFFEASLSLIPAI